MKFLRTVLMYPALTSHRNNAATRKALSKLGWIPDKRWDIDGWYKGAWRVLGTTVGNRLGYVVENLDRWYRDGVIFDTDAVRKAATDALAGIPDPRAAKALRKAEAAENRVVPRLIRQLRSSDSWKVTEAAYTLSGMYEVKALPPLRRLIGQSGSDDSQLRRQLEERNLPLPDGVGRTARTVRVDQDALVSIRLAIGKIEAGPEGSLVAGLRDTDSEVREAAAEALMRRAAGLVRDPLDVMKIRPAAPIPSDGAIIALVSASEDRELRVRRMARGALIEVGGPAIGPLLEALDREDSRQRVGTSSTLYRLWAQHRAAVGVVDILQAFQAAVKSPDIAVVAGAYQYFVARGETATEAVLIDGLKAHGHAMMAEDFLNCGNSQLAEAGKEWAARSGLTITVRSASARGPRWGSGV